MNIMRNREEIDGVLYDNFSLDKKVGFIEEKHRYIMLDNPKKYFTSVTSVIKKYKEPFEGEVIARKLVANPRSEYFGRDPLEVVEAWNELGRVASEAGTRLHLYSEYLINGEEPPFTMEEDKAKHVRSAIEELWSMGYSLATTELLVYSDELALAGQSDIVLRREISGEEFYMIYDWKFLSKPLVKNSYYNNRTRKYKNMSGPFKYLNDCNWIHYSIQLAIYQTMTGSPERVTEKVLVVVTDENYKFVPAYPMRVFWDHNNQLQAIYECAWREDKPKFYDSRTDKFYKNKPRDILGF